MAATGINVTEGAPTARFDTITFLARYGTILSLVLLLAIFSFARPEVFPSVRNLLNILNQVSILGIIAIGLTVCLVIGQFDLSIGALATFGGYFATRILMETGIDAGYAVSLICGLVLILAMLIGVLNGALVSYLGISAIVETLAMGFIVNGIILGISGSRTISPSEIPAAFKVIGQGTVFGIPNPVLVMIATAVVLWLFLEHTQPGRNMYAIGGNKEAARLLRHPGQALCAGRDGHLRGLCCAGRHGRGRKPWRRPSARCRRNLFAQRLRCRLHRRVDASARQIPCHRHRDRCSPDWRHQQRPVDTGRPDLLAIYRSGRAAHPRTDQRQHGDAAAALRSFVKEIILTPGAGELKIDVGGDLAGILAISRRCLRCDKRIMLRPEGEPKKRNCKLPKPRTPKPCNLTACISKTESCSMP